MTDGLLGVILQPSTIVVGGLTLWFVVEIVRIMKADSTSDSSTQSTPSDRDSNDDWIEDELMLK